MEDPAKQKKRNNEPPENVSVSFKPILVIEAKFRMIPMRVVSNKDNETITVSE